MPDLQDTPLPEPPSLAARSSTQRGPYREGAAHGDDAGAHVAPAPASPPFSGRAPVVTAAADSPEGVARRGVPGLLSRRWVVLGTVGFTGGALALGMLAHRVAHPLRTVAIIAALGGVAGAAIGAALPSLARAVAWSAVALATLAIGAAALWGIHQVDPFLIRQLIPRW